MSINTNPVTFVYKIPKQNYRAYNKAGLSFGSLLYEDTGYVYIKQSTPVGTSFTIHNGYQYGGGNASYNVKLSSTAPKSPSIKSYATKFSTIGEFSAGTMKFTNKDLR